MRDVLAGSTVANGRLKGLKLEGGSFVSPSLSYDARQVLFAYVECSGDARQDIHTDPTRGHWSPGRCSISSRSTSTATKLEQLTDGTWNDFDPCWLPNGRIAFITERRGGYLRCGRACPTYTLFDMAADGSDINCLSFHETNEWQPSVTHDGRIIYTRWDYVDRYGCTAHLPWITTLDGRDSRAVHGNFSPRQSRPDMELNVRAIPGSQKFIATAAPHHGQAYGSLVLIDPRVRTGRRRHGGRQADHARRRLPGEPGRYADLRHGLALERGLLPLRLRRRKWSWTRRASAAAATTAFTWSTLSATRSCSTATRRSAAVSPIPVQATPRQPVAPLAIKPRAADQPLGPAGRARSSRPKGRWRW